MAASAPVSAITQDLGTLDSSGTNFTEVFVRYFGAGSPLGSFTDYYTFNLNNADTAAGSTVSFDFGFVDLALNSVSLYATGDSSNATVDTTPGTFSFSNLSPNTSYTLAVKGTLKTLYNVDFGFAYYQGTIHSIASAAPEPGWIALLLAGVAGLALHARRRRSAGGE
jgi:MYXO-CTERM domain-containing protein